MLGTAARRSIDETLAKYRPGKWRHPPPPPSPRILQLPRRSRRPRNADKRKENAAAGSNPGSFRQENACTAEPECKPRGKLEVLFGQERKFSHSVPIVLLHPNACTNNSPRRGKVTLHKGSASRQSRLGASGSVREHCSDDARDIFELESQDHGGHAPRRTMRSSNGFSSDNDEDLGDELNGRWNSEDWKFQAEVLRAECNLLRMEKEVAVRRWEQGCAEMEHAVKMAHSLHSAVQALITGRKKIVDEKNAEVVLQTTLQNQIEELQVKLEKLRKNSEFRENELKKCSNFDRQAMFLQRRLDKLRRSSKDRSYSEDTAKALQQRLEKLVLAACSTAQSESDKEDNSVSGARKGSFNEAQRLAEDILRSQRSSRTKTSLADQRNQLVDVALLRKRLDSLSMGMNESKEAAAKIRKEYRSMLSSSGNCSSRRTDAVGRAEQGASQENKLCSERCKATIRKIAEQVQAETEQWSQVQEILHHVREEMEDLQKSRDFWEDHALHADEKVATLQVVMHEWRAKARLAEIKISELQSQAAQLRNEIELVRHRHAVEQTRWFDSGGRHTGKLLSSNSVRSSIGVIDTDLESLDHHEASISGAEMSNQSANREKADYSNEDEKHNEKNNSETKYMQKVKPRISKAVQKSHICSQKHSIKSASKLCEIHSNQQSASSMHLQQKDCVTEQLSQKRTKTKIQTVHSKENLPLQNKHPNREIRKFNQPKRNQGSMGSGKSSCSSSRSPLADIGNASPFRIRRAIFPLSSDESSGLGSV